MFRDSSHNRLIIGLLVTAGLAYISLVYFNDVCCIICFPVIFLIFIPAALTGKFKAPRFFANKEKWPDNYTIISIILIILIWILFGWFAFDLYSGNSGNYSLSLDEMRSRLYFMCLPLALIGTAILLANEMKQARKCRGKDITVLYTPDDDITQWEKVYFTEHGIKRAENTITVSTESDKQAPPREEAPALEFKEKTVEQVILPFCPGCGSKLLYESGSGKQWCRKCQKYVK